MAANKERLLMFLSVEIMVLSLHIIVEHILILDSIVTQIHSMELIIGGIQVLITLMDL